MDAIKELIKETEHQLFRYPERCARIESMKQELKLLEDMDFDVLTNRPGSIVRISNKKKWYGPTDPLDAFESQIEFVKQRIEIDESKAEIIRSALETIRDDTYYMAIEYRYFRRLTDDQVAQKLSIGKSTVRRHRKRLLYRVVAYLLFYRSER